MTDNRIDDRTGAAILVALGAGVAGYLPSAMLANFGMKLLRPMGHAEEAMGRELAALFIGGPIGAILLALLAGWLTHRSGNRMTSNLALLVLVAGMAVAFATAKYMQLL